MKLQLKELRDLLPPFLSEIIILPLIEKHLQTLDVKQLIIVVVRLFLCCIIIQQQSKWCLSVQTNIYILLQTMKLIWLSIHQHKPKAMYLGLTPMLNYCRLSGHLNLLSIPSPWRSLGICLGSAARAGIHTESSLNSLFRTSC